MTDKPALPLYYADKSLADMESMLRNNYLTSSGWIESAYSKLALRNGKPIPWFTYSAISFLERELTADVSIFEYGGGQSTLYWADRVKKVVSVDHDRAFVAHVSGTLPANAEIRLVEEGRSVTGQVTGLPELVDPPRDTRTYRSGQLNVAFQDYALKVLDYPRDHFDVVIVDGMARTLSTWAGIQHFNSGGFIVFDNSDRDFYQQAYDKLEAAGYRRIDFWGLGPINPYEWCTSVFYQPQRFTGTQWFPRVEECSGESEPDSDEAGILVLGFNRPYHLQSVLESLRLQDCLNRTHVWIDGTQGRGEYKGQNDLSVEIAKRYPVKEIRAQHSHLGIEKMMLDGLDEMTGMYDRVIVLEDDCFPLENAIAAFEHELNEVAGRDDIYSVYGHHFGTEPDSTQEFSRFQGWGWAAHSGQIRRYLPRLRDLFMLSEQDYLNYVDKRLTDEVKARLDITPGRDVLRVLASFFSWDSATAFLTAIDGIGHRRTERPVVVNTGIVKGIGHFHDDTDRLRSPPFNMIPLDEAWDRFDVTTRPCDGERESYGLDELDKRIIEAVPLKSGFFVELGAYDGVTQSNSVLLENRGWKGLLIEANPGMYAKCVKARPKTEVVHAACVASDHPGDYTTITDVGLMSMTVQSNLRGDRREEWINRGEGFINRSRQEIDVPVATLSSILDRVKAPAVDILLLDVEGSEVQVLKGLDFARHAPTYIVAEDAYDEGVADFLVRNGYERTKVLLERKYTRDCLYERTQD